MSWPPTIGKVLPRAHHAYGVESKLRAYVLNSEHDVGTHKARVFRAMLGITIHDVKYLAEQLLIGLREATISHVRDNAPHGVLCEVSIPVQGIGDAATRVVSVTTSWEYRSSEDAPRLVSAYIEA